MVISERHYARLGLFQKDYWIRFFQEDFTRLGLVQEDFTWLELFQKYLTRLGLFQKDLTMLGLFQEEFTVGFESTPLIHQAVSEEKI
jgi:hypothetical protein